MFGEATPAAYGLQTQVEKSRDLYQNGKDPNAILRMDHENVAVKDRMPFIEDFQQDDSSRHILILLRLGRLEILGVPLVSAFDCTLLGGLSLLGLSWFIFENFYGNLFLAAGQGSTLRLKLLVTSS